MSQSVCKLVAEMIPLKTSPGLQLTATDVNGICHVAVLDANEKLNLPWDRYMRLKVVSDHLRRLVGTKKRARILDVGGFDGALALFLSEYEVDLIDPATTSGSGLEIPLSDREYEIVVSIDVIEHVTPDKRSMLIKELTRISNSICLINFPNKATMPAQELVYALTGNSFVREHVELGLPEKRWVMEEMQSHQFDCQVVPNTNLAIWTAQHTLSCLHPQAAATVSRYLVQAHSEEQFSVPLYYLVIGMRRQ